MKLALNEMGPVKMAWFPMVQQGAGSPGSLAQGPSYEPSTKGTLVYFAVADIEKALVRIKEKGGKAVTGKIAIGEHGFIAHFEDCEGNRVSLHSRS